MNKCLANSEIVSAITSFKFTCQMARNQYVILPIIGYNIIR